MTYYFTICFAEVLFRERRKGQISQLADLDIAKIPLINLILVKGQFKKKKLKD